MASEKETRWTYENVFISHDTFQSNAFLNARKNVSKIVWMVGYCPGRSK